MTKNVVIGSENPVKLAAARTALGRVLGCQHFVFTEGVSVPSGVSDQPQGEEEIMQGAVNRACSASIARPGKDLAIGIEGGIVQVRDEWYLRTWAAVLEVARSRVTFGSSPSVLVTPYLMKRIGDGLTMEEAADELFGTTQIGRAEGYFGLATRGVVTRESALADAVIMALAPLNHPDLF